MTNQPPEKVAQSDEERKKDFLRAVADFDNSQEDLLNSKQPITTHGIIVNILPESWISLGRSQMAL